jgi:preprotein translocase SecE subunit
MATDGKPKKRVQLRRKSETVRERADKSAKKADRAPRTRKVTTAAMKPVSKAGKVLKKEYTPIKVGRGKLGKALNTRKSLAPSYFVQAFRELRQVTWPTRKTVAKLTLAVFAFSIFLAAVVTALDFGFERLFRDVILK